MIPYTLFGMYTLIGCSHPKYIGSELFIDYNNICLSLKTDIYGCTISKKMHGTARLKDDNVNVLWRKSGMYELDAYVLPVITYPYRNDCKRTCCTIELNDPWITIIHNNDKYVFRKNLYPKERKDTFLKLFVTQLILDLIIRHI